jgi:hypothetical protein
MPLNFGCFCCLLCQCQKYIWDMAGWDTLLLLDTLLLSPYVPCNVYRAYAYKAYCAAATMIAWQNLHLTAQLSSQIESPIYDPSARRYLRGHLTFWYLPRTSSDAKLVRRIAHKGCFHPNLVLCFFGDDLLIRSFSALPGKPFEAMNFRERCCFFWSRASVWLSCLLNLVTVEG